MCSSIWDSIMANMLVFYVYYFEFENGQHVEVLVLVVFFGFGNGQHVDAQVFVVSFWNREWSSC